MFGVVPVTKRNVLPRSLISDVHPPEGFDENWRHVLNDVGEFRLVEMWEPNDPQVVEYRDDVQEALDQSLFRVSDACDGATTPQERGRLASILKTMMQGAVEGEHAQCGQGIRPANDDRWACA